jgi:hypothetical protein
MISHYTYEDRYREATQQAKDFLAGWRKTGDDLDRAMSLLKDANETLRSACSIASREGRDTNWQSFRARVEAVLKDHHQVVSDYFKDKDDEPDAYG